MGILSIIIFIIGYAIGGSVLSGPINQLIPVELPGVCLVKLPLLPWCMIGFSLTGLITGLIGGIFLVWIFRMFGLK